MDGEELARLPVMELPPGFQYRGMFVSEPEEADLLAAISQIEFSNFEMRGAIAKRRVAFFGRSYSRKAAEAPIPAFLEPLRARLAEWAKVQPDAFAMALINDYHPGAPIGWHRDAPQYDQVAGLSLGAACVMKFRPYVPPGRAEEGPGLGKRLARKTSHQLILQPRSAYLMTGSARQEYEHSIPPVADLRYSITFRTLRPAG
jgi:alkylated DNA repair dioxygenase AlkB